MPAAAGWGAAEGQVSPGGKSFPFRSSFHCKPCPGGAAPQTAEPFWCLTASLLLSPHPCLLTIASLMLSNCRTGCHCSAAPALRSGGPRKRQQNKDKAQRKGRGGKRKQELQVTAFQLLSSRFLLGCFHLEIGKGGAQNAWGNHTLSHRLGVAGGWFHKWILPPYQRPFLFLGNLYPFSSASHPVWWYKSYPGTKFRFLDKMLKRGTLLQMLQRLIETKMHTNEWKRRKEWSRWKPTLSREPKHFQSESQNH